MKKIDRDEYDKVMGKLSAIFANIAEHAQVQAQSRCPYKNLSDCCTAQFGCRNRRKPQGDHPLPICAGDDKLDYRTAWETDPESVTEARAALRSRSKL